MDYRVTWEMDITADNPVKAAKAALAAIRRRGSWAHVFDVFEDGVEQHSANRTTVDLLVHGHLKDVVTCSGCRNVADAKTVRLVDGAPIGECCWDIVK